MDVAREDGDHVNMRYEHTRKYFTGSQSRRVPEIDHFKPIMFVMYDETGACKHNTDTCTSQGFQ